MLINTLNYNIVVGKSFFTIVSLMLFFSCNQPKANQEQAEFNSAITVVSDDKQQLEKLTRSLYEWKETKSRLNDFEPLESAASEYYRGLDLPKNEQRIAELKSTGLFSDRFIANYRNIAASIDLSLKEKTFEWLKGDLPPFGVDAEIWCNCQDSPEGYWQDITIKNLKTNGIVATFSWSIKNNPDYTIKAAKENNVWKILFLEEYMRKHF
jgi:hypothetical protein